MIQTILAFFGYVKIPKEVVQLNIALEDHLCELAKMTGGIKKQEFLASLLKTMHKSAHAITQFLQSGRMLG